MISKLLKKNEKGFTLMEMLIVVAIIAVLIAIAIPTFNASLNKANIRSGYATVMATVLTDDQADEKITAAASVVYWLNEDGSVNKDTVSTTSAYSCAGKTSSDISIAGTDAIGWQKNDNIKYTYTYADGKIAIEAVTPTAGG